MRDVPNELPKRGNNNNHRAIFYRLLPIPVGGLASGYRGSLQVGTLLFGCHLLCTA